MRRLAIIAAALVTAALVFVAGAVSASAYWEKRGPTYKCNGGSSVFCWETNWDPGYKVAIVKGKIAVTFDGIPIFACDRGYTPSQNCEYFGWP